VIEYKRLGDIATIIMGQSPKGDTYNNENVGKPLINGPTEFGRSSPKVTLFTTDSKRECEKGDLIFCVRGSTTGRMNWADQNYSLGRGVCSFRGETLLATRFIRYALEVNLHGLLQLAGGGTFPNLTKDTINDFKIPFPKAYEKYALIANEYDNLIENNNRRITILEDMAQSLYCEWFVNFRYPGHADGKTKLTDSPLGQIPEGWEVKRLDDYVVLQRGFDLPKRNRNEEGGIPIYAASGITGYHDQVKAKGPGIVTGRSGTLGIVNLVLEDHWPLNTSLWVKEFKICTAHYAYYLLDGIGLERFNSGASVPTLNRNDVHGNPVIAPPTCLIEKFESIASVNHKQIHLLKRKNENLKKQRDMLLPKLISGKIEL